jgi:hypothetical protein
MEIKNPIIKNLLIGAGVFAGYKILTSIFKSDSEKASALILSEAEKEKKELQKKYKLSFNPSQYPAFANIIYESTKYGIGDNYGAVVDTLKKLKNDLDVNMLIQVYGAKQNYIFGIPQGAPRDLFTNLRAELGNEYGGLTSYRLNKINEDWAKKGIKYKL